jgi:hypothetical protein
MLLSSVLQTILPLYSVACYMCQSCELHLCIEDYEGSAEEKGGPFQ